MILSGYPRAGYAKTEDNDDTAIQCAEPFQINKANLLINEDEVAYKVPALVGLDGAPLFYVNN